MENLFTRLTDLLKIKNIITLMATIVFMTLALTGTIGKEDSMMVVMLVYTYFFNKNTVDKNTHEQTSENDK